MRHLVREDDGKLDESTDNLLGVVLIPRRLVDEFLLTFLRDGVDIGGSIIQEVTYDLLRTLVVALHQVAPTGVAVHLNGAVVLIKDFAVLGADRNG